jgi:hypothetical protein
MFQFYFTDSFKYFFTAIFFMFQSFSVKLFDINFNRFSFLFCYLLSAFNRLLFIVMLSVIDFNRFLNSLTLQKRFGALV